LRTLLRHIQRLTGTSADGVLTDRDLLQRFVRHRQEDAFAVLVQRHGALVLNVCRRLLRSEQDTEDVFQATFLLLARKASSVPWRDSVGPWLHSVALRLAQKLRTAETRRE
jgi:RNA polymerase sigma-70 factor (ECF subfamily)